MSRPNHCFNRYSAEHIDIFVTVIRCKVVKLVSSHRNPHHSIAKMVCRRCQRSNCEFLSILSQDHASNVAARMHPFTRPHAVNTPCVYGRSTRYSGPVHFMRTIPSFPHEDAFHVSTRLHSLPHTKKSMFPSTMLSLRHPHGLMPPASFSCALPSLPFHPRRWCTSASHRASRWIPSFFLRDVASPPSLASIAFLVRPHPKPYRIRPQPSQLGSRRGEYSPEAGTRRPSTRIFAASSSLRRFVAAIGGFSSGFASSRSEVGRRGRRRCEAGEVRRKKRRFRSCRCRERSSARGHRCTSERSPRVKRRTFRLGRRRKCVGNSCRTQESLESSAVAC